MASALRSGRRGQGFESPCPDFFMKDRKYIINEIKSIVFIILGVLSASIGLKSFILPNNYIDGGITGVSLLANYITKYSLSLFLVVFNLPFLFLGWKVLEKNLIVNAFFSILGLSLAVALLDFPILTKDKVLVAIFGGFFLGLGIGLAIRGGSVLDGTEILAIYLSKKTGFTIGDIIFAINVVIFSVAAYLISVENSMYSLVTYISASKTVDLIVEGLEEYVGVTIISSKFEEIKNMLIEKLGTGITIYNGRTGKNNEELQIIYTVISRLELAKLKDEIEYIDDKAFVVINSVKETRGGVIKKKLKAPK